MGISEHCGHALTYKILTGDTKVIIYRSVIRPVTHDDPNLRATILCGEENDVTHDPHPHLKSRHDPVIHDPPAAEPVIHDPPADNDHPKPNHNDTPVFNPADLLGRTFLMEPQEDGQRHRAKIVQLIEDHENEVANNPTRIKFCITVNEDKGEDKGEDNSLKINIK